MVIRFESVVLACTSTVAGSWQGTPRPTVDDIVVFQNTLPFARTARLAKPNEPFDHSSKRLSGSLLQLLVYLAHLQSTDLPWPCCLEVASWLGLSQRGQGSTWRYFTTP
eukprot:1168522-Amphidinium_carterae.2